MSWHHGAMVDVVRPMSARPYRDGLAAALVASGLALLAPLLWVNPWRLLVLDDHRWIPFAAMVPATFLLVRAGATGNPYQHVLARAMFWFIGVVFALCVALGLLLVALVAVMGPEESHTVVQGPGGVEVHHIVVETVGLSANTCQFIDLRRGGGLLRRHNIATYCAEADGEHWTVEVIDSKVLVSHRYVRCQFAIDTSALRLVDETGSEDCSWLVE
jgi:hypothetical protein